MTRDKGWAARSWESVRETIRNYKFYLASEFTHHRLCDRTGFHALAEGTVPVYRGAPNIREFMPANDAIILPMAPPDRRNSFAICIT